MEENTETSSLRPIDHYPDSYWLGVNEDELFPEDLLPPDISRPKTKKPPGKSKAAHA